ncbi:hypothetical protein FRACYDRAFT_247271 [Fragilariopsis cylindrus CCMP1102]|uniref:Uncharacterized protein n=1 Tax=Fragilariopsis cylindrus CCMP1102 TaxID=635003 RepID=A0A1E7EWX5_9STRA|nr:hypothetical protein FRACYDRAFT_247271 [Fragilariopsis cylindrus CCMP1102]|eukprot:OEU10314.1 hypothetical protein FRACYDRAFT_247271 [Fragilariopsis cylindrus CCMP1102]
MDDSDSDNDHQLQSEDEDENEDEVEDEDDQPLTEEERIAAAAEDAETSRVVLLKVISILERKVTYPALEDFFFKLEEDVHEMLCSNDADADADDGDYRGLDNNRDTEAEVEAIAVSFIPVVARLAIEFGCLEEEDRGGLLCYGNRSSDDENVLRTLMHSDRNIITNDRKHHQLVDDKYLLVMKQLRQVGLLKKDDIQRYGLLEGLCFQDVMAEKRFRFLVEWDPTASTHSNTDRSIPLIFATMHSIEGFRLVFEYGIHKILSSPSSSSTPVVATAATSTSTTTTTNNNNNNNTYRLKLRKRKRGP